MKESIINASIYIVMILLLIGYYMYVNLKTKEQKTKEEVTTQASIIEINTDEELEKYLVGVVACEMPALYETEALKAQAITSRTYALYQRDERNVSLTNQDQCIKTEEELKETWKDKYDEYYNRIKNAVNDTKGTVMKKDDKLFKSFYFSTSNGFTEDSITVFKEGNISSVSSPWDKENKKYEVVVYFEKAKLNEVLGEFNDIEITKRNTTNHVEEVKVDDKIYSGIEFRKLLNLRSTDFEINQVNDTYEIKTRGYGHGVGMSQFGANMLAKESKTYEEILKYYYGDIELKKY